MSNEMTEPTFWSALTMWWKEATTLTIAIAGLFGLRGRANRGNKLPTKTELELALSKHEQVITKEIANLKDHVDSKLDNVYKVVHHLDEKTNERINGLGK